jgi:N-methylhydantoinase A
MAALGVVEMVDENMSNAARVHAIESGKSQEGRVLIAFGGGGPVHATRIAEKIGIDRILVPSGAGVGSAIGFLRAPVGYEVVRSLYQRLDTLDLDAVNAMLAAMRDEAASVVGAGATAEVRTAFMRYVGQGHEIAVALPARRLGRADAAAIRAAYDTEYTRVYDRPVPGSAVEVTSWSVKLATPEPAPPDPPAAPPARDAVPARRQRVRDPADGMVHDWDVYERTALRPGDRFAGPAIVAEDETSTLLGRLWRGEVDARGYLHLHRKET